VEEDQHGHSPKFRIDVDIHNLLMHSSPEPVKSPVSKGMTLPEPVFPRYPEKPRTQCDSRESRLEMAGGLPQDARLALSLHTLACAAG
jgi:hypothetical protein